MARTKCGFDDVPGGAPGHEALSYYGPTLVVDIVFDPTFRADVAHPAPVVGLGRTSALVDTGASESCIDSMLATQLNLPIIDRRMISGSSGAHQVNVHMAQIYVVTLNFWVYGAFAAVDLAAGGQAHRALIGRTFLSRFTMIYEGRTGTVTIHNE